MDSAVHATTGKTLDQWTGEWARSAAGLRLTLGPAAPPLAILSGLLPALLALGAALWYAARRQIG
jgi:type IV secretory pathway TrbD component